MPTVADSDAPTYEQARDELTEVVRRLEAGGVPLEEALGPLGTRRTVGHDLPDLAGRRAGATGRCSAEDPGDGPSAQ